MTHNSLSRDSLPQPSRRQWLQQATAAGSGLCWLSGVAQLLAREAETAPKGKPAKSVILLWLAGGPSQLETFDPHPNSKIAYGTRAIETSAAGVQLAAGFELLAEQMHHVSLVRSLVSKEGDHERGTYLLKTGYRLDPTVIHPSLGAICCHGLSAAGVDIPRHVSILPTQWPARGGYLGAEFDAFKVYDPQHGLPDVKPRVEEKRFQQRLSDLEVLEQSFANRRPHSGTQTGHRRAIQAARQMMSSEQLAAFDVSQEPDSVQRRYGGTPFGRGCLAARRLIEVGVRCVEVTLGGWDTHANNHGFHTELVQTLDPALAALLVDLQEHDLLDQTVVLCGGEFGRTPQLNPLEGRDHWPHNFTFAVAGGGLRGGLTIGETDPDGGRRVAEPHHVADLHATVLTALGIRASDEIITPIGRPLKLSDGQVIQKLIATQ